MENFNKYVIFILVLIALFIYSYGIYQALKISIKEIKGEDGKLMKLKPFINNVLISISALLAANFGAIIGLQPKDVSIVSFISDPFKIEYIQMIMCVIYLAGLLAALSTYAIKKFDDEKMVPILLNFTVTLSGLAVAALALFLKKLS